MRIDVDGDAPSLPDLEIAHLRAHVGAQRREGTPGVW
jgi:hypothetical protein